jgi:hypothetical protein
VLRLGHDADLGRRRARVTAGHHRDGPVVHAVAAAPEARVVERDRVDPALRRDRLGRRASGPEARLRRLVQDRDAVPQLRRDDRLAAARRLQGHRHRHPGPDALQDRLERVVEDGHGGAVVRAGQRDLDDAVGDDAHQQRRAEERNGAAGGDVGGGEAAGDRRAGHRGDDAGARAVVVGAAIAHAAARHQRDLHFDPRPPRLAGVVAGQRQIGRLDGRRQRVGCVLRSLEDRHRRKPVGGGLIPRRGAAARQRRHGGKREGRRRRLVPDALVAALRSAERQHGDDREGGERDGAQRTEGEPGAAPSRRVPRAQERGGALRSRPRPARQLRRGLQQAQPGPPARAARGTEPGGAEELVLEVAHEVVAHGRSPSLARIPARPRETRLRMTDSEVCAASAISP